ncbi:hypothetical protein K474DRAFT_1712153 [Panus rudis PR-1116 ss-1]|nr:hypothetical protein K474DRAFT_1712153 [Panus rudis PR-1116 ss-1]
MALNFVQLFPMRAAPRIVAVVAAVLSLPPLPFHAHFLPTGVDNGAAPLVPVASHGEPMSGDCAAHVAIQTLYKPIDSANVMGSGPITDYDHNPFLSPQDQVMWSWLEHLADSGQPQVCVDNAHSIADTARTSSNISLGSSNLTLLDELYALDFTFPENMVNPSCVTGDTTMGCSFIDGQN